MKEVSVIISMVFVAIFLYLILSQAKAASTLLSGIADATLKGIHELQTGSIS